MASENEKQLDCTKAAVDYQKAWFAQLRKDVFEAQKPYALVQADMPMELFYLMDMPVVSNQWWAAVISAKQLAGYYMDKRKECGFHEGLCSYCSLGFACTLDNNPSIAPWGGLPKPAIMSARLTCDCIQKVFELWAEKQETTFLPLDSTAATDLPPNWWELSRHNWTQLFQPHRLDFMVAQQYSLVAKLEEISGKKFEMEALKTLMEQVNLQEEYFEEACNLIANAPKTPVRMAEQISNVMTAQWHRGSAWAVNHAKTFRDEVKERVENGIAANPNEKLRLMWVGAGLWHDTGFYTAFEEKYGAVFVWSMYLAFGPDGYIRYGLDDPMRALASRVVNMNEQLHNPPWANEWIAHQAQKNRIDAALVLIPKGSRPSATGSYFIKQALEAVGIPTIEIWTDMVDGRAWNGVEMREKVGNFLENEVTNRKTVDLLNLKNLVNLSVLSTSDIPNPKYTEGGTFKSAFQELKYIYENPLSIALEKQRKGIPVIGFTSVNIPTELIEAATCFPLLLPTQMLENQDNIGDQFMEPVFDTRTRSLFNSLLMGDWSFLKLLIISRTSDAEYKLFLYLKEAIRQGFGDRVPPIYLYDLLETPSDLSKAYGLKRTIDLKEAIEQITAKTIIEDTLKIAIISSNNKQKILKKLFLLRGGISPKMTGTEAMIILGAAHFMDKNRFIDLTERIYKAFSRRKPTIKRRLMIKGYPLDNLSVHQSVENDTTIVVLEDTIYGNPDIETAIEITDNLLQSIVEKYYNDAQNPRIFPMSKAQERFEKAVLKGIEEVVFYFPDDDDVYGWHFPQQLAFLEKHHILSLIYVHA